MSLKKFKRYLLNGLIPPDIIVGINWDQNGAGEEIHPVELLSALVKPKWYKECLKKIIKPLHTWLYT